MLRMMLNALRATIAGIWQLGIATTNSVLGVFHKLFGSQGPSYPVPSSPLLDSEMTDGNGHDDLATMQKTVPAEHLQTIFEYAKTEASARNMKSLDGLNRFTKIWVNTQSDDTLKQLATMKAATALKTVYYGTLKIERAAKAGQEQVRERNKNPTARKPHSNERREFTSPSRRSPSKEYEGRARLAQRINKRKQLNTAYSMPCGM